MTATRLVPGLVVGLSAEARIAAREGYIARAGGGTPAGAAVAARALLAGGRNALVSFGLAGALDPGLRPGTIIVPSLVLVDEDRFFPDPDLGGCFGGPSGHEILAGREVVASRAEKQALWRATGAHAVDLESGAVARVAAEASVPFAVVRAICDPAERSLPPAALIALDGSGGIVPLRVLGSVLRRPSQLGALLSLARDAAAARSALLRVISTAKS